MKIYLWCVVCKKNIFKGSIFSICIAFLFRKQCNVKFDIFRLSIRFTFLYLYIYNIVIINYEEESNDSIVESGEYNKQEKSVLFFHHYIRVILVTAEFVNSHRVFRSRSTIEFIFNSRYIPLLLFNLHPLYRRANFPPRNIIFTDVAG